MIEPKKETISYAQLLEKLQALLVCYLQCRNIHIDAVEVYQDQIDGANWHVTRFRRSGDDNDLPACREKITSEVRRLRQIYNVLPG